MRFAALSRTPIKGDIASVRASAREGFANTVGDGVEELSGRPPRSFRDVLAANLDELVPA